MSRSHQRNVSTIPTVNAFNNWFNQHETKSSILFYQSRGTPGKYSSTISVNPQSTSIIQNKVPQMKMRRTHSAFRNNQSRVSTMKDEVFDLGQDLKHLQQKTKNSKLQLQMLKRDLSDELKQQETQIKQQLLKLSKFVKQTIKMNQIRTEHIKTDTIGLRSSYESLKHTIYDLQDRLSTLEHDCGFMTFASKLYK